METRPCLIIGASGNIGEATAHKLIAEGRPVALTHSLRSAPVPSLTEIEGKGKWYAMDVRDSKSVNQVVADVQKDFKAVPDLVYCAGITKDASLSLISDETWDDYRSWNMAAPSIVEEIILV